MSGGVAVVGWSAFVPGFASVTDWLAGRASAEHAAPVGALVPLRDRRRASPLSRALADAYAGAVERAGFEPAQVASVFGSALGEVSTMIGLLDQMWSEGTPLSPMKFATSVHNAAAGVISIATANRGFTTSLGADYDTPAMALVEGLGWASSRGEPVVVCCGDEAPPDDLVPGQRGWSLLAVAVALCPLEQAPPGAPVLDRLAPLARSAPVFAPPQTDAVLGRNPSVGLFDLVVALERGIDGVVPLDRGDGRGWGVRVTHSGAA